MPAAPAAAVPLLNWGRKWQPHRYRNSLRRYAQFCIFVLTAGTLHAEFPAAAGEPWRKRIVRRGQALALPRGADFDLSTPDEAYDGHLVEWAVSACPLPPYCRIATAERATLATIAEIEAEYARADGAGLLPVLYQVLGQRLLRQLSAAEPGPAVGAEQEAARIDERLRAHVHTAASLAAIFGGDAALRRVRRVYRAARGGSPKRTLLTMKLQEAERLLRQTRLGITAIALDLGFPSAQHFATQFRRWRGVAPGALRREGRAADAPVGL